ncbi:MAG: hypothetical protein IT299_07860 [Dehalococcoidia bacterium]|nr:hypothetical protein [Dehalococcoidia bacterium]
MSTFLRLLLVVGLGLVAVMIVMGPHRARRFGKQLRLVGFVYVLVVLMSAALRVSGVLGAP